MSNTLAIAALTAVLEERIAGLVNVANYGELGVTVGHPSSDGSGPSPGVYIQCYRVAPSLALRNADLPTRRADGSVSRRPRLAIEVDLLLSFVGDPSSYDAERLAGLVMTDLHARPELAPEEIDDYVSGLATNHVLAHADLGDQLARVRLSPLPLSLEDLSRVWGLTGQSFYGLSVAYRAAVIILDAEVEPSTPLPVQSTGLVVMPRIGPVITSLESSARAAPVIAAGETLIVRGRDLRGDSVAVQIGAVIFEIAAPENDELRLTLAGVRAGLAAVEVLHRAAIGPASDPLRTVVRSNTMPLAVVPTVTLGAPAIVDVGPIVEVHLEVAPPVTAEQAVVLLLDPLAGGAQVQSIWAPSPAPVVEVSALVFELPALASGDWLVRVVVDEVASLVSDGGSGSYDTPKVTRT